MGESKEKRGSQRLAMAAAMALLIIHVGCSSAKRQRAEVSAQSGAPTANAGVTAQVRTPAKIDDLRVTDDGRSASIELVADRPLVWTSFRNPDGDLVVELPNSLAGASVSPGAANGGLVSDIEIERLDDAERPLTRFVVRTSSASEHSLTGDGNVLRLELLPIDSAQDVTLAYEPIDEPEIETLVADSATPGSGGQMAAPPPVASAAVPQTYGTPEAPQLGPTPQGVTASQLYGVEVLSSGSSTVVQISGDGDFTYSTFRLENPDRFVVDLTGVVNTGASSTVRVGSTDVDQIRVGQFRPRPEPVSRVVFDLHNFSVPSISRTGDGMLISFGDSGAAQIAAAETLAEPMAAGPQMAQSEPEPEPVEVVAGLEEDSGDLDAFAAQPEVEDTYEPVAEPLETTDVAEWTPPPVAARPSAPAPAYQAPPITTSGDSTAAGDVSLFEAQDVDLDDQGRTQQERLLESFGPLVVSRQEREYVGDPISMSLKNADLVETLRSFAKISDLNFVIQPGVRGTVTVELKGVPWDQAMEQILKINNLGMDIDGTIVRIAPTKKLRQEAEEQRRLRQARQKSIPLRTVMRSLSYARAGTIARLLRSRSGNILSRRGSVQVDSRTNTLIIRELPDNIDTVLAVIDSLDTASPQVTIEARIVEATKSFSRSLGIAWGFNFRANNQNGNTTGLQFPNNVTGDGGVGLITGGSTGFLNFAMGNILDTFRLNAQLVAAEAEGLVNIVSAPRITTLNNHSASIQSGVQIPIQTVSDRTVSVQFVNATLRLRVTPQVAADGTVVLNINVAKRIPQLGLLFVGASGAPISTRDARTKVRVRDGATAVIGGIYEVSSNQSQDRVPGLARVPILGHLFKNRNRSDDNNELMIFITPRIIQF